MVIFEIFKDKIWSKYTPKRTKLHHFKKISRGSMPPNPPSKAHGFAPGKCPHFSKNILNPPPPRNEILDTSLLKRTGLHQSYQSSLGEHAPEPPTGA